MTRRQPKPHIQLGRATAQSPAAQIFLLNDRINQMLIEHLDPAVWKAKPPTIKPLSKAHTRNIAAIFSHMHNVRCKWVRLTAPHLKLLQQLNRSHCTPKQAGAALAQSATRCAEMLAESLGNGRIKKFRRDGWARPWPVGSEMLCYMLSHEAHHRGQVCMLAHQLGSPLPNKLTSEMWNWERLSKETGFALGSGY